MTSLGAGLATTPYALYHFDRLVHYGIAANMVAVPLTAVWIMPLGLAAMLLMPFGLEAVALVPMGWGVEAVLETATIVAAWPGAIALVPAMPDWALGAVTLGGLWLALWRRPWRLGGLADIAAGAGLARLRRAARRAGELGRASAGRARGGWRLPRLLGTPRRLHPREVSAARRQRRLGDIPHQRVGGRAARLRRRGVPLPRRR